MNETTTISSSLGSPDSIHPDQWTTQQVIRWLNTLIPSTISTLYSNKFKENDIVGEALIQLDPETLKDIGVLSVGHRLSILKAIYELKIKWGIEVEADDWKPISQQQQQQDGIANNANNSIGSSDGGPSLSSSKSMASISVVVMLRALQERDERVRSLELELARLEDWLVRWTGEMGNPSKVDPLQPYFPPTNGYSSLFDGVQPLYEYPQATPQALGYTPDKIPTSAFSGPMTAINSADADTSRSIDDSISFSGATSSNLATTPFSASSNHAHDHPSRQAPGNVSQVEMSPTSSTATPSATPTSAYPPISLASSSADNTIMARIASPTLASHPLLSSTSQGNSASVPVSTVTAANAVVSFNGPTGSSQRSASSGGPSSPLFSSANSTSTSDGKRDDKSSGSVDTPYKSFRVTLDDPCHKVLPAALKKYKINDDWKQYALFICYGTTERCLSYDEKPLLLFQKLKEAKQSPVFMLRHIRDVKSPIAIASAKAAARKSANGSVAGTTKISKLGTSNSGSSLSGVKSGGNRLKDAGARAWSEEKKSEEKYIDSLPGQPRLTGPASQLDNPARSDKDEEIVETFAIAIYPYVSEREDELDVSVGDTFVVKSKAKGWWVVQRDAKASGQADVVGIVKSSDGTPLNGGEIKSGWVPAGCLLETKRPLSLIVTPSTGRNFQSPITPGESSTFIYQQQRAPASPGGELLEEDANTPKPTSLSKFMAHAPIPPSLITSTSTPGILLMDFHSPEENIHLEKDIRLRVFKRYNHWSYCVEEGSRHARAWLPSWYIGKISSSRSGGGGGSGSTNNSLLVSSSSSQRGGTSNSARSEALPLM